MLVEEDAKQIKTGGGSESFFQKGHIASVWPLCWIDFFLPLSGSVLSQNGPFSSLLTFWNEDSIFCRSLYFSQNKWLWPTFFKPEDTLFHSLHQLLEVCLWAAVSGLCTIFTKRQHINQEHDLTAKFNRQTPTFRWCRKKTQAASGDFEQAIGKHPYASSYHNKSS